MNQKQQRYFTAFLFAIYLLALIWIIVFKLHFSLSDIPYYRSVNLIPLKGSAHGELSAEVLNNVYIFIPFGLYLSMLKGNRSFFQKALIMALTSTAFECTQYFFAIGASDVTDIIGNTLGGIIGIVLYALCHFILKAQTNKTLNRITLLVTICIPLCLVLSFLYHTSF